MEIKDFKKAILDNYQNSKERKTGDYWSNEIKKGLDEILNYADDTKVDIKEIKSDLGEIELSELADSMVDPYTIELLKWYSEDLGRCCYADEFLTCGQVDNFIKILSGGQYIYYYGLLSYAFNLVKNELKDLDLEADEIMEGSESLEKKAEKLEKL